MNAFMIPRRVLGTTSGSILAFAFSSALLSHCLADEPDFKFPKTSDYPKLQTEASRIKDFVPKGWTVRTKALGDLNGDKLSDAALVVQGNIAKYKQTNSGLGTSEFDTNPRLLLIILKKSDGSGYRLAKQTKNVVAGAEYPTMEEPLESIAIKNGVLEIHVQSFYNAGSWSASNTDYKFQCKNGNFVLIGAEHDEVQRNTGENTTSSYNFLSGKLRVDSKNIESDDKKRVSWKMLPRRPLRDITKFTKLYEWEVLPGCYL